MRDILGIFDMMDQLGRLFHDPEGRRRRAARRKAHAYDPYTNRSLCGREIPAVDRYAWGTLGTVDCERCLSLLHEH